MERTKRYEDYDRPENNAQAQRHHATLAVHRSRTFFSKAIIAALTALERVRKALPAGTPSSEYDQERNPIW